MDVRARAAPEAKEILRKPAFIFPCIRRGRVIIIEVTLQVCASAWRGARKD